jgi:hypothetical protein
MQQNLAIAIILIVLLPIMMQESEFFKQLKASEPFFVMAGPNVVQSEEHVLKLARQIKAVTDKLGLLLVFKSSFDKANRTSATSFRGPGLEEGLRSIPTPGRPRALPIMTLHLILSSGEYCTLTYFWPTVCTVPNAENHALCR